MIKRIKINLILVSILIISFGIFYPNMAEGQVDSILEIEEKLSTISDEEKKVLEELFLLIQEIEAMEREIEKASGDVEVIKQEVRDLERSIESETIAFEQRKDDLKKVLQSYQRMGASSYIKIILESDSITALLRRINTIRDITRNTGNLLDELEDRKASLELEKINLEEKLSFMEKEEERLKEALEKSLVLKDEIENYLTSMAEERAYYTEHLNNIQFVWNDLKLMFYDATKEFNRILTEESLPEESLKTSITLKGIKGLINEKAFNDILSESDHLPKIEISFYKNEIKMNLPEKYLVLSGQFTILDGNKLEFDVRRGSFFEMELEASSIEDLFKEGPMVLDLEPVIGKNTVRSIEILEGYIELLVIPSLTL